MNINVRSTILLVNAAIKRLANPSRIVILSCRIIFSLLGELSS